MTQRAVRFTTQFFDRLDQLLPSERSAGGRCSTGDFLVWDLPAAADHLARDFDSVASPLPNRPDTFSFVTVGRIVGPFVLYAELDHDQSIEVFWLDLDIS